MILRLLNSFCFVLIIFCFTSPLQALWASNETAFGPRELKWAVGEVREEFLGFAQQDTQELLAFLLDGIHEDLNRVRKKPYYEVTGLEELQRQLQSQRLFVQDQRRI